MFWAIRIPFLYILCVLYGIIHRMHPIKNSRMKLKLTLLLICLLGVGLLTRAQKKPVKPNSTEKVTVVDGKDAIPVTVKSNKKSKVPPPPPPPAKFTPPVIVHNPEQPAPPPPPEKMKIKVNKHIPPPPPPPEKPRVPAKATVPDAPPAPDTV